MDPRILKAMRLMERGMDENLHIEQLAALCGLSLHHFHRLFVAEVGEPPAVFLRRIRMDTAALRMKWTSETDETLAHAFGFSSRPAFTRAFQRQFGMSPARYRKENRINVNSSRNVGGHQLSMRELDSFHLLVKRYIGNIFRMRQYWTDFMSSIPDDIAQPGKALLFGLLYDDFRITDPDKVRYDCGITVSPNLRDEDGSLARRNLHLFRTMPGRYVTMRHRGHFSTVETTYDLICHGWIVPNGHLPSHNPALELYTVPRNLQDGTDLDFTVLFPVE